MSRPQFASIVETLAAVLAGALGAITSALVFIVIFHYVDAAPRDQSIVTRDGILIAAVLGWFGGFTPSTYRGHVFGLAPLMLAVATCFATIAVIPLRDFIGIDSSSSVRLDQTTLLLIPGSLAALAIGFTARLISIHPAESQRFQDGRERNASPLDWIGTPLCILLMVVVTSAIVLQQPAVEVAQDTDAASELIVEPPFSLTPSPGEMEQSERVPASDPDESDSAHSESSGIEATAPAKSSRKEPPVQNGNSQTGETHKREINREDPGVAEPIIRDSKIIVTGIEKDQQFDSRGLMVTVSGLRHRLTISGVCPVLQISGNGHFIVVDEVAEIRASGNDHQIHYRGTPNGAPPIVTMSGNGQIVRITDK